MELPFIVYDPEPRTPTKSQRRPLADVVTEFLTDHVGAAWAAVKGWAS